jgi:phage baseplate assembly protein W|tara:strand:- start:1931 stop:2314 length:384 start_codon:yes stop_codon:yes gene_type:complete
MAEKYLNISFPFEEDPKGKFLKMEKTSKRAIKSDLLHLLLTQKRQRLYLPSFGVNLRQYIFEQNDGIVHKSIQAEIETAIKEFIPNLTILEITVNKSDRNEKAAIVRLDYKVTSAAFAGTDFIEIEL